MSPEKAQKIKTFLINTAIGPSAVRNQGNGIIAPIRWALGKHFDFDVFFDALLSDNDRHFTTYLNRITQHVAGLQGFNDKENQFTDSIVQWGTARKCINLFFRAVVYSGHVWEEYGLHDHDFTPFSPYKRLELPLDSYAIDGLSRKCQELDIQYNAGLLDNFRIIHLNESVSKQLQSLAQRVSEQIGYCRVDLDIDFWRAQIEN